MLLCGLWAGFATEPLYGQPQAADIRVRLARIHYREFHDLSEYVAKSQQVAGLLPELAAFYQTGAATIKRLSQEHGNNPDFMKMANFYAALNAKDQEGFALVCQEVELAKQLADAPVAKRQDFYKRKIAPLHAEEDRVSLEEIDMVAEAKKHGMPLPEDVSRSLAR